MSFGLPYGFPTPAWLSLRGVIRVYRVPLDIPWTDLASTYTPERQQLRVPRYGRYNLLSIPEGTCVSLPFAWSK
jgi:hypothetical protein